MKYQKASGRSDGRYVVPEVNDRFRYEGTTSYTPERLKAIFDAANSGDIELLCLCGREILERNWDVIAAMEQRSDALQGVEFDVQPGGDAPQDAEAAEAFDKALRACGELNNLDTFYDLVAHLTSAVVMPFAAAEIVWAEGGNLQGFASIEPHHFTLRDSFVPRLVCNEWPNGMPEEEAENRFVFHQFRKKSDPARSGKIRVLAWLHCFQNWPLKDLFSFIERFGMPFVVAKVDQKTWDDERNVLHHLIRSFGPNGGGVFTQGTELQLLNAANTGSDNVYFRALQFTHDAIYTLIVGQLASSSDASGMSNGDAQTAVRQDILEADARAIESTVRARIAAPWTKFHFAGAAVPKIHFKVEPSEDQTALATTVATLFNAGLEVDPAEMSERFGLKLTKRDMSAGMGGMGMDGFGQVGQAGQAAPEGQPEVAAEMDKTLNLKQKYDAMGVAIRAGLLTATPEIEAQTRAELGLPVMTPEVQKAWDATGGIRQPITLKTAEAAAVNDALNVDEAEQPVVDGKAFAAEVKKKDDTPDALIEWLGPIGEKAGEIATLSDDEFDAAISAHAASNAEAGSSEKFDEQDSIIMARAKNGN